MFYRLMEKKLREDAAREKEDIKEGDDLAVTVNKVVKVYIASRRQLQVGDKMPAATAIKASSPRFCRSRICRFCRMERLSTLSCRLSAFHRA